MIEVNRTLTELSSLWGCDANALPEDTWDMSTVPPLALAYRYTEKHIELASGLLVNGVAVSRLRRLPIDEAPASLDDDFHHNPFEDATLWYKMQAYMLFSVRVMQWITHAGVVLIHSSRMAPDWGSYITYSTERRPQAGYALSFLTVGHVEKSATLRHGLTTVVRNRYHAFRDGQEVRPLLREKRTLCEALNCTDKWLPGAVYVGNIIQLYRSEHFLSDAQAADI